MHRTWTRTLVGIALLATSACAEGADEDVAGEAPIPPAPALENAATTGPSVTAVPDTTPVDR